LKYLFDGELVRLRLPGLLWAGSLVQAASARACALDRLVYILWLLSLWGDWASFFFILTALFKLRQSFVEA